MPSSYSHSALKTFDQCPRKYKFQYVERPDVPKFVDAKTALGQIVHTVLQRIYVTAQDLISLSEEQMIAFYLKNWEEYKFLPNLRISDEQYGVDDFIRMGEKMLREYYATFHPFQGGILLGAEMNLSFVVPNSTYRCTARVDRLWKRDDGTIEIWDYKTGGRLPQVSDPVYRHQMGLYQLAVTTQHPQFEKIELVQYFLQLKEEVRCVMTLDELDEIAMQIRNEIVQVREAIRLDSFPPQESPLCNWCEYFNLCPAKRHRRMLDEESDEENQKPLAERLSELAEKYIQASKASKQQDEEVERLREEIVAAAREHALSNLEGESGQVKVSIKPKIKFVTKSEDEDALVELNELARREGLDTYFKLDTGALIKDLFSRDQLPEELKAKLEQYVMRGEDIRVSVSKKKRAGDESSEQ